MRGWKILDVLALGAVAVVFASLLIVLGCTEQEPQEEAKDTKETKKTHQETPSEKPPERTNPMQFRAHKVQCMNNAKNLAGMLEAAAAGRDYPKLRGPNLVLYFAAKGYLKTEDNLSLLFCPGDKRESLAAAGGPEAYADIDLKKQGEYDHLTSYAGRDQLDAKNAAHPGSATVSVLVCDDSEDHHAGRGFVVGLTGGAARWRDKVDNWGLDPATNVVVGEGSVVEELRCLRAE
jgi:hypothetical protein